MSHLQYCSYEGPGQKNLRNFSYDQAVHTGDKINVETEQGGWDPSTGKLNREINAQMDLPWSLDAIVRNFDKWVTNHKPIWTRAGVTRLGEDDMRVEVEVVAHDRPEGAARA
ncbi:hypothetical protein LZ30DRAFT_752888 [Colletotrichum cereale]|nr:hypothetical protein LZ30DRAFT_752888 [Colletotrichum cereale]